MPEIGLLPIYPLTAWRKILALFSNTLFGVTLTHSNVI